MKILVFQVNYLGDFVAMLPTLGGLRRMLPSARITIVTSHTGADLLQGSGCVDEVMPFDFGRYRRMWRRPGKLFSLAARLRRRGFTGSLSAHDECTTSALLALLGGIPLRVGFRGAAKGSVLYTHRLTFDPVRHVAENRYAALGVLRNALGSSDAVPRLERVTVRFSRREEASFRKRHVDLADRRYVVVHPFAKVEFKEWPAERFAALAPELSHALPDMRVVMLAGGRDIHGVAAIDCVSIIRDTSLRELAWLLAGAEVLVGNNSGPMNLALAMGTPVVAITGPSPRYWWPSPFEDVLGVVITADMDCVPCETPGRVGQCLLGRTPSPCMTRIQVDTVLNATLDLLRRTKA